GHPLPSLRTAAARSDTASALAFAELVGHRPALLRSHTASIGWKGCCLRWQARRCSLSPSRVLSSGKRRKPPSMFATSIGVFSGDMGNEGEDERAELARVDAEWSGSIASGDVDRILSYWTDDAIVLPPGAPPLSGKQAIRDYVTTSLGIPGFSISWETDEFRVAETGDMAYGIARNRVTFPNEGGDLVTAHGKSSRSGARKAAAGGAWSTFGTR